MTKNAIHPGVYDIPENDLFVYLFTILELITPCVTCRNRTHMHICIIDHFESEVYPLFCVTHNK